VTIWLDPFSDPLDDGYQIVQSAFALADGGIFGTGLGQSGNAKGFPAAETDFIFVFIGQELGLLGATLIIIAFLLFVGAGLRIAIRSDNTFDKLLATGLSALLGIQAFIILAGVTRLLPLTGVTLPFVSYGGSSLISNYVIVALLLRIADETTRRTSAIGPAP
jgi:peptidoglycan glycosyltransferase